MLDTTLFFFLKGKYNSTYITCQSQIHIYYNTVRHYCVPSPTVQITRLSFGSKFQRIYKNYSQKQAHVRGGFPVDRILRAFSLILFSSLYFRSSAIDLAPPAILLILVISWLYSSSAFALFLSSSVCKLRSSAMTLLKQCGLINNLS